MKTEIEYRGDNLTINFKGIVTKDDIKRLRTKINNIIHNYGTVKINIDAEHVSYFDYEVFEEFIYDYENNYKQLINFNR